MYLYSLLLENSLNKYSLKLSNTTTRVLKGIIVICNPLIITNLVKFYGKLISYKYHGGLMRREWYIISKFNRLFDCGLQKKICYTFISILAYAYGCKSL